MDDSNAKIFGIPLDIFVSSWNVGNSCPNNDLREFIPEEGGDYDMLVLGMQESTYKISDTSYPITGIDIGEACILDLKEKVLNIVGREYILVQLVRRSQMQVFVIAKKSLLPNISNVQANAENTGILGIFPNKGGILIGMDIYGTSVAFISCHLAAHEGVTKCQARNDSIVDIIGGLRTRDVRFDVLANYHHVIWIGDLNYRINFSYQTPKTSILSSKGQESYKLISGGVSRRLSVSLMKLSSSVTSNDDPNDDNADHDLRDDPSTNSRDIEIRKSLISDDCDDGVDLSSSSKLSRQSEINRIYQMILNESWMELLEFDELTREMRANRIFNGFTAAVPSFPPTFKRIKTTSLQELNVPIECMKFYYSDNRLPSYTDRILYKSWSQYSKNLELIAFQSCERVTSSDHKPVVGLFQLTVNNGIGEIDRNKDVIAELIAKVKSTARAQEKEEQRMQRDRKKMKNMMTPYSNDQSISTPSPSRAISFRKSLVSLAEEKFANVDIFDTIKVLFSGFKGSKLFELNSQFSGGLSDPYIIVCADPREIFTVKRDKYRTDGNKWFHKVSRTVPGVSCVITPRNPNELRSRTINHNVNPVWDDTLMGTLLSSDLEGLTENVNFIISVWDADFLSDDDLIGACIISFKDVFQAAVDGNSFTFKEPLMHLGLVRGYLEGVIKFEKSFEDLLRNNSQKKEIIELAGLARPSRLVEQHQELSMKSLVSKQDQRRLNMKKFLSSKNSLRSLNVMYTLSFGFDPDLLITSPPIDEDSNSEDEEEPTGIIDPFTVTVEASEIYPILSKVDGANNHSTNFKRLIKRTKSDSSSGSNNKTKKSLFSFKIPKKSDNSTSINNSSILISSNLSVLRNKTRAPDDETLLSQSIVNFGLANYLDSWVKGGSFPNLMLSVIAEKTSSPTFKSKDYPSAEPEEIFFHASGDADVENKIAISRNSIFRLYSMTKPIITIAVLILLDRGQLSSLDEPLYNYIPSFRNQKIFLGGTAENPVLEDVASPITLRHLLTHTSGIAYGIFNDGSIYNSLVAKAFTAAEIANYFRDIPLPEFCSRLSSVPVIFQPGTAFTYGLNTDILGHVIEVITKESLRNFLKKEIFDPLQMNDTDFFVPEDKISRLVKCYDVSMPGHAYKESVCAERDRRTMPALPSGGGGLVSTMDDYIKFVKCLLKQTEIQTQTTPIITSNKIKNGFPIFYNHKSNKTNNLLINNPLIFKEMITNQLPGNVDLKSFSHEKGFSETIGDGVGFGLGVSVIINKDLCKGGELSSNGEYGWGGFTSTWFFINPVQKVAAILMAQLIPSSQYPIRPQIRWLVHKLCQERRIADSSCIKFDE